jgi:MoaA/NifB/PqqE/SkfB family radical SAM enzyme
MIVVWRITRRCNLACPFCAFDRRSAQPGADADAGVIRRFGEIDRIRASASDTAIPVADCHPGERFLFVNEAGLVSPCSFTSGAYGVPVSELDGAESMIGLPRRFARARHERNLAVCEDCQSTQVFEKFAMQSCNRKAPFSNR